MSSESFKCHICKHVFKGKKRYDTHIKSISHSKAVAIATKKKEDKLKCNKCGQKYATRQSLSRHRLHYCKQEDNSATKSEKKLDKKELDDDRVTELTKELNVIKKLLLESMNNTNNNTINNNTTNNYKISIKNYVQQQYPNAPALTSINDYSKLTYKEFKLLDTIIYQYENNTLHKYLGDFIVDHYKKKNPSEQSMWSSDISRLTYIVSELLQNKQCIWNHDFKGTKIKQYVITPVLEYIQKCIEDYYNNLVVKKSSLDINKINEQMQKGTALLGIKTLIDNGVLLDLVLKYIAPYFSIDKNNIGLLEDTNKSYYFIDNDEEEEEEEEEEYIKPHKNNKTNCFVD